MKIGIVGSGIAGLTAAWILNRGGYDVTVFEKQKRIGIDAHSIRVSTLNGEINIDVPSRMFNEVLWPKLSRIYNEIGVEYETVDASQSFGNIGRDSFLDFDVAFRPRLGAKQFLSAKVRKIVADLKRLADEGSPWA